MFFLHPQPLLRGRRGALIQWNISPPLHRRGGRGERKQQTHTFPDLFDLLIFLYHGLMQPEEFVHLHPTSLLAMLGAPPGKLPLF
ncbi:hypothetical protein HY213_01655 [Candidatus Peregrinibacteria bacterium]|nr:hypothetical protein [Candidatus Peregrinibacteria bacterium]